MTHEGFQSVELGRAEKLIEAKTTGAEEIVEKFEPGIAPYVEFESHFSSGKRS